MKNKPETSEQKERRWRNTRRMAWLAMFSACAYPLLVVFTESKELGDIAWPFYTFISLVVGYYVGFSTAETRFQK